MLNLRSILSLLVVSVSLGFSDLGHAVSSLNDPAKFSLPADLPTDLPLDPDGIPTRALNDDELWRLLLGMSARNEAAAALILRCHIGGTP
jgi:hypothetical protein